MDIPRELSMYGRNKYSMLSCSKRCSICGCHGHYQKWVRSWSSDTLRTVDFDTEWVWQDYIHRCCKARTGKLYWLKSNGKNLKLRTLKFNNSKYFGWNRIKYIQKPWGPFWQNIYSNKSKYLTRVEGNRLVIRQLLWLWFWFFYNGFLQFENGWAA